MKRLLVTLLLVGSVTTANAADLTSCAATYTVASAAFSTVGENRNADGAAYYAIESKRAALRINWGGQTSTATSMYKQALWVQESRFKSNGWPALSKDLSECGAVLKRYNIQ